MMKFHVSLQRRGARHAFDACTFRKRWRETQTYMTIFVISGRNNGSGCMEGIKIRGIGKVEININLFDKCSKGHQNLSPPISPVWLRQW
jgi:hypothetical protein